MASLPFSAALVAVSRLASSSSRLLAEIVPKRDTGNSPYAQEFYQTTEEWRSL